MTSMAVAQGPVAAAAQYESELLAKKSIRNASTTRLWRSASAIGIVAMGLIIGLTSLRGRKGIRIAFQIVVIVFLGLVNGDLLSMGMFAGWAQNGIPWQNAFGRVVLATAAVALPIVARSNVYCSHLCPHGAVQQLLPRRWKQKSPIPRSLARLLISILVSLRVPMAYCRFGCGTGAILQYLRRHSRSDRLTRADFFAFACFVVGLVIYWS